MIQTSALIFLVVLVHCSKSDNELTSTTEQSKIFVHPITNATSFLPPNPVVPTSAHVSHEPGVPPGWNRPTRPVRPTRTRPTHKSSPVTNTKPYHTKRPTATIEVITSISPPIPSESIDQSKDPDRNVIDWILGLFNPNEDKVPEADQSKCPLCACGLTYKHNRIVGGTETQVNEYPWMTVLTYQDRFYCAASVINNKYLLTAAHCVSGFSKDGIKAIFLDHDRSSAFETKTFTRRIKQIISHRSYNQGGSYNNDIALLKLEEELPFVGILKPVCLPAPGRSFTGNQGIVTGWGAIKEQGMVSNKLLEVKVPIMSNSDCRRTGYKNKITDNMMCAGYPQGMKDSCQGDSGGPLHVVNGTFHTVAGVVSWGEGCAQPNFPGVYTRVNKYITWIHSNTKDACYCKQALIK